MSYTTEDVSKAGYHAHHGPQPVRFLIQIVVGLYVNNKILCQDGEVFNNSWLEEMDKYLKG